MHLANLRRNLHITMMIFYLEKTGIRRLVSGRRADPVSLVPGTIITIPANVKHWHGAKKDSWFSHLTFAGPPAELKPMVEHSVMPLLEDLADEDIPHLRVFRLVGIGESDLQELVDDSLHQVEGLEVAYCARVGEVDVRLVGSEVALKQGDARLRILAGAYVLAPAGASLEKAVVCHLAQQGLKAATAESCTGGLIAKRITDVPGASGVFEFGWVTYADRAKTEMLGVPENVLKRYGAVSEPVVKAMAEGALERSGADVAVAVSGIAGPGGGTPEKPVGTVWLAWAFRGGETRAEMMLYPRDRSSFRKMVSQRALAGLLDARRKEPVTE